MIAFLCLFVLVLTVLFLWLYVIQDAIKLKISGPFPLPIVGNGHMFIGDSTKPLRVLDEMCRKYNDVCRLYILSRRYVAISHPKHIEPLLSSPELINKGRAYDVMRPWLGEGLLTSSETAMGTSFNTQSLAKSEYLTAIDNICRVLVKRSQNPLLANDFLFNLSPQKNKMNEALRILHKYSDQVIQSRRKEIEGDVWKPQQNNENGTKNKRSFLDILLLADVDGGKFNYEAIFAQVSTFMFAGHDTVAAAIMFTIYCISNNKVIQEKILEEQKNIFNDDLDRDPTYGELQQMKYLEQVIKESLRLYPPVPVIERLIVKDVDLGGLHLPKDTLILVSIFSMHRNPKIFENAMEFKPERFENNSKPFEWTPYSAGPRNCIGQKYSMLEMKITLSSIVKHFELLPSGKEPIIVHDIVLKSKNGVYVCLVPRF